MNDVLSNATPNDVSYSYRPSLLGAAWSFRLTADGLAWEAGRKSGVIPYHAIRRLRLSYKPVSMQTQRYLTEVWADAAPKLEIVSSSWKSIVEQERLDKSYSAFVSELHRRIARLQMQSSIRYEQGSPPLLYWPGLIMFAGIGLGLALLTVRALQADAKGGAAFIAAFMAFFLWQGGNFFRRNRPGVYNPGALPDQLMPKG